MSSQDGHLPPPPPPPRPGLGAASAPLRRRHGLTQPPTISTASLTGQQTVHSAWSASTVESAATPLSPYASTGYSPFAQQRPTLSAGTSPMAMRAPASMVVEYNPQEWGRGGPTGGAYRPHAPLQPQASREADPMNGTKKSRACMLIALTVFHRYSLTATAILASVFTKHYAWYTNVVSSIDVPAGRVRVQQSSK
jgi:hypothetical protein